jgi:hypothetical protein
MPNRTINQIIKAQKHRMGDSIFYQPLPVPKLEILDPAFYSYTYPAPGGIDQEPLQPEAARWIEQNGSPMALLMYDDIRNADDPEQAILDFLESAYRAGASQAGWDMESYKLKT